MKRVLLAGLAVLLLALPSAAAGQSAAAARSCPSFSFKHNGIPWSAKSIRAKKVYCRAARRLIKAYATPRNCQFRAKCKVRRYTCRTLSAEGSRFTEKCTRGGRVVRWRGSYVSS